MASQKEYTMLFALNASLQSGFQSTFGRAQQSISSLQKEINSLARTQSNISAYQKQQSAIEKTTSRLELYKTQLNNLKSATAENAVEEAKLANAIAAKEKQISDTSGKLEDQTKKLDLMGNALEEAGVDTSNLTGESKRLSSEMDKLKDEQEKAAESAQTFGEKSAAAIDAVSSAILAAGLADKIREIGSAYMESVQTAGNFEASMSQVAATMGTTSDNISELGDFAKEMGATTSFTAIQASEGLNILAMAGLNAKDQMSGLPTVLDLAAAGGMDMAQAASYITASVKGFGDSMDHAGYYADLMAKGASLANTNVEGLGEAFAGTAANARTYNQAADSVTLSLLRLADQNVVGSSAATALNRAYADLFTPTAKEAKKAISELGVSMYDLHTGEARDFNDIIDEMNEKLSAYSQEEANALKATIFTAQGLNAFNKMTASTNDRVQELWKGISDAGGAASEQAATQLDNMNGELTIMQSAAEGLSISLGDLYKDDFRNLYSAGTELLTMVNNFVKQNPALVKGMLATGGALGGLTTAITGVAAATKALKAAQKAMQGAELGALGLPGVGQIMAIAGAIAAVTGAMVYLYEKSDAKAIKDLTKESRELSDSLQTLRKNYGDNITDNQAAANAARGYIDRLRELQSAGEMDAAQKQEYHNILAILSETMPDLADKIDLVTDSIEGGIPALEKSIEDWEKYAEQMAKQEYEKELRQGIADATKEQSKNQILLAQAQNKARVAAEQQETTYKELLNTLGMTDEQFKATYGTVESMLGHGPSAEMRSIPGEVRKIANSYVDYGEQLKEAERDQQNLDIAIQQGQIAIDNAVAVANDYTAALESTNDSTSGLTEEQKALNDAMSSAESIMQSADQELLLLAEAYTQAYDAALKSVQGQYQLWDEAGETIPTTADTINAGLESQIKHWEDYNSNLESLRGRTGDIEGLSEVIASFADGSQESINAIAGMAEASDEDLQTMVENYQQLQTAQDETSESIGALATDLDARTQEMAQSVQTMVEEMNLSGEAEAAARSTVQSYISAASGMKGEVRGAFAAIRAAALSGLNSGGGGGGGTEGYASGTDYASPGVHLVGEKGPELLYMRGGERVIPADKTEKILREKTTMSNAVSVSFNISGGASESTMAQLRAYGDDFAARVERVLEDIQQDQVRRSLA